MAYVNTVASTAPPPWLHLASGGMATYTICGWVKVLNHNGFFAGPSLNAASFYATVGPAGSDTDAVGVEGPFSAKYMSAGNLDGGTENDVTDGALLYEGWLFVALVVSGGTFTTYTCTENMTPHILNTGTVTGTMTDLYLSSPFTVTTQAGKYSSFRTWSAALTQAELAAEASHPFPVRTASLFTYLSCDAGSVLGKDQSGHGNDWTPVSPTVDVGEDSISGSISAPSDPTIAIANGYTLSSPAFISSLSANITVVGTAGNQLNIALYSDGGSGLPGTLLVSTGLFTPTTGWNTIPVSLPILPAGTYYVAVLATGDGTLQISGYVSGAYSITPQSGTGGFPAVWASSGTGTFHPSVYAKFNVGYTTDTDAPFYNSIGAPVFRDKSVSALNTLSIADPGQVGDLILLWTFTDDGANDTTYFPPTTGTWTLVTGPVYSPYDQGNFTMWWGTSAGPGTTYTMPSPTGSTGPFQYYAMAYSGANMSSPISGLSINNPGSFASNPVAITANTMTPSVPRSTVILLALLDENASTEWAVDPPTSPSLWATRLSAETGFQASVCCEAPPSPVISPTGSVVFDVRGLSNPGTAWIAALIGLAPQPPPPVFPQRAPVFAGFNF